MKKSDKIKFEWGEGEPPLMQNNTTDGRLIEVRNPETGEVKSLFIPRLDQTCPHCGQPIKRP